MSQIIESSSNKVFKELLSLHQSSGIKKHKKFLVSGQKVIREFLSSEIHRTWASKDQRLIFSDHHYNQSEIIESLNLSDDDLFKTTGLKKSLFSEIDIFNTQFPILELSLPELETWEQKDTAPQPTLLSAMGDPSNLGAVIRCADAFGVKDIVLLKESSSPFHPKSIRASSGSFTRMHFYNGPSINQINIPVLSLDMQGTSLEHFSWPQGFYLLVGEEGMGVPSHLEGQRLSIPMSTEIESLNAAVSMGIALYSYQNFLKSSLR